MLLEETTDKQIFFIYNLMQLFSQLQSSKNTELKVAILPHKATQWATVQKEMFYSEGNWTLKTETENNMKQPPKLQTIPKPLCQYVWFNDTFE